MPQSKEHILEILNEKEQDVNEAIQEIEGNIATLKQREQYLKGRVYEVQYIRDMLMELES